MVMVASRELMRPGVAIESPSHRAQHVGRVLALIYGVALNVASSSENENRAYIISI